MTSGQRTFFADERHAASIRGLTTPDADEALVKHECDPRRCPS